MAQNGKQKIQKVQFVETVLRDANQSLIATRLPYDKFEAILPTMDKAGYYACECWGGATFDVCLRYLHEDPWERLRKIRAKMPNTKLQMLLRGQNVLGYSHYPDDFVRMFVRKSVENGIDIIRIFDALNDVRNLEVAIDEAVKCRETGEAKTIVFGLTGTGYFDMVAYEKFHNGKMTDYIPTDAELEASFATLPQVPGQD